MSMKIDYERLKNNTLSFILGVVVTIMALLIITSEPQPPKKAADVPPKHHPGGAFGDGAQDAGLPPEPEDMTPEKTGYPPEFKIDEKTPRKTPRKTPMKTEPKTESDYATS